MKYKSNAEYQASRKKTEVGVISRIYSDQKERSKIRGHDKPKYTKEELEVWLYSNDFKNLYDAWVESGFKRRLKPSVDRICEFKTYQLDNITLTTCYENVSRSSVDRRNGVGNSGKICRSVTAIRVADGVEFKFHSQAEAARKLGIRPCLISNCVNGRQKQSKGYKFKKKENKMKLGISLKIDVTKIDKARLFQGKNGAKYLDVTTFVDLDNPSQYGDHGFITQDVSKEERAAGVKGNILGNTKVFYNDSQQQQQFTPHQNQTGGFTPQQQVAQQPPQGFQPQPADIPFDDTIPF